MLISILLTLLGVGLLAVMVFGAVALVNWVIEHDDDDWTMPPGGGAVVTA